MKDLITIALWVVFCAGCRHAQSRQPAQADRRFAITKMHTSKGPGSVEAADVNRDGRPDLIVANTDDSSITVYLNAGNKKFTVNAAPNINANRFPNDISVADLNADSIPDLAIANTETSMLTVLAGDGTGKFTEVAHSPFRVHSRPHTHGVAVGDFNNDRNADLATDDWGEDKIVILYGDGHGNFDHPAFVNVGKRPYQRLRTADLNHDHIADIVTTNLEGNNATILLGDGSGHLTQPPGSPYDCGSAPFGVAIGDVNGDGNADLAIADSPTITAESQGVDGLWILLGDGHGVFRTQQGSPFRTGKSPSRLAIADLDGDHVNDIVVTNYNDQTITVFYMASKGVKDRLTLRAGRRPDGVCIADLDNNGKNDIVITNYDDDELFIYYQR